MKKLLMFLFAIVLSTLTWGQGASTYTFAISSGTYTAITGGTVLITGTSSMDSWASTAITIPSFNFCGNPYTTAYVTSNGILTLGGSAPSNYTTTGISSPGGSGFCISPFGADLDRANTNATTEIRWETVGDEIVFQWKQVKRYNATENFDFQVRLNTSNNKISFIYQLNSGPGTSTTYQPQVGIRNSATSYKNLSVASGTETWASPLSGASNSATCRFTGTSPAKNFTSGLTYTFTPPNPCTTPTLQPTNLVYSNITSTTLTGSYTAASGSDSYLVVRSTDASLTTLPVDGTVYTVGATLGNGTIAYSGSALTFNATGLSSSTQYYYYVYSMNSSCTGGPKYYTTAPLSLNITTGPADPTSITPTVNGPTSISLNVQANGNGDPILIAWNTVNTFGTPTGLINNPGDPITGGGTILYSGSAGIINHTGLTSATTYYYKVWSKLGSLYSGSKSTNATTLCLNVSTLPFTESFDGITFAPNCWTNVKTAGTGTPGIWDKQTTGSNPTCNTHSGAAMARFNCYSLAVGTKGELSTPAIDFPNDNHRVKFWFYRDASAYPTDADLVNVYYNTTNTSSGGTLLGTINRSTTLAPVVASQGWYEYSYNMPTGSAGSGRYVIFEAVSAYGNNLFLDDVTIEAIPSCVEPSTLAANSITSNTATATWVAGATETLWNLEYGVTGFTQGAGAFVSNLNATTYNFIGLTGNTNYSFYVQSNCGSSTSPWSGPYSFKTLCDAISVPVTQNFDGVATPNLPDCWTKKIVSTSSATITTTSTNHSASNGVSFYNSGDVTSQLFLISPKIVENLNTLRVKLWAYSYGTYPVKVGVMTDPTDAATFVEIASYPTSSTWTERITDLNSYSGTATYIAIKFVGTGTYQTIYVDDVSIDLLPSCLEPTALNSTSVTSNSATINWIASTSNPTNGYEYEIRTSGAAGSGATGLVTSGTTAAGIVTANINSLTANTTYYFYVRSDCGSSNYSNWTTAGSFITLCNAISSYPLVENFDGTWVGSPAAPSCWKVVNVDGGSTWSQNNTYITPTPSSPYAAHGMGNNNDWLISPAMVINGPIVLKWKDKVESASYRNTYSVKVSITDNNTSSFATTVQTYDCINTSWIEHSLDLSSYVGSTIYIAFHQTYSAATNYGFGIDDVKFLQTTFPTVTTTTATALTGNSATSGGNVTNDGNGTISARGVCWSVNPNPTITNDKTTDGTGIGVFVSNITGLNANTLYYYRAYATNAIGTAYGDELSITTLGTYAPSVTTNPISSLTNTTVTLSGEITANGGDATISESGIVYSTSANPTIITGTKILTNPLISTGIYNLDVTALTAGQTYYFKAFATNNTGTGYGSELSFTTKTTPTVTTTAISNITTISATGGGNVTNDGGDAVTARGICWATTATPTLANSFTTDASGTGIFTSSMANLIANGQTYYVRAYATNAYGTTYGNQVSFVTNCSATNIPYTQNFDGVITPAIPACMTVTDDNGISPNWATSTGGVTANAMKIGYTAAGAGPLNDWFFTPSLNLTAGKTYKVSFKYKGGSSSYVEKLEVKWGAGANATAMTSSAIFSNISFYVANYQTVNAIFTPISSGLYNVGWHAFSVEDQMNIFVDDISITEAQAGLWTGATNNDWATATNWDNGIVPSAATNVTIPATATNFPTVTTSATINNLTIESNATGTGSLLDGGNLTINGTATVKQYVVGDKWHLISSPIQNATANVFHLAAGQADIYIREFNSGAWSYITDLITPIVAKKGYSIWADCITHSTPNPTISFTGVLNTGVQTLPTTGGNNWDLIGNPYTSAIDWDLIDPTNVAQSNISVAGSAVRVWNQTSNVYSAYSKLGGSINNGKRYIAPMQGFFVQSLDANGITLNDSYRVHNGQQFVKSTNSISDLMKITAQRNTYKDEINVVMNPIATNSYDFQYDATKLFVNDVNIPEIYTVSGNKNLVINIFGSAPIAIPMNIRMGVADNVTLTASEFANFDANVNITLEDMLTGTTQDLRQNPTYTFAATIGENANRFVLHFATPNGINEPNAGNISIYANNNNIYVNTSELVKEISVYNMLGQVITTISGNAKSLNTISMNNATGNYVVKVTTEKGVRTEKVFVK